MSFISCSFQRGNEKNLFHSVSQAIGYIDTVWDEECKIYAAIDVKVNDKVVTYKFEKLDDILENMMNL